MRAPSPASAVAGGGRSVAELLAATEWMLPSPATQVHAISLRPSHSPPPHHRHFALSNHAALEKPTEGGGLRRPWFRVVRDDLLHPLANGNKARKLDALLPLLRRCAATDVITCGGCQSAHAAAVAVHCAEWGIRSHLLLRGEQPEIPTGYNLVSLMFGNVTYAPRSVYAQRDEMLYEHARQVAGAGGSVMWADDILGNCSGDASIPRGNGSRRVVIVKEGAGSVLALLGVIRLVKYLSDSHFSGKDEQIRIVVDAGTGTTAVGLALGAVCLRLPWKVTAVMLADTIGRYKEREKSLIYDFKKTCQIESHETMPNEDVNGGIVQWVERAYPRKFGKVLNGEIALCRQIAQETGILLDPMYTLAAWEKAADICRDLDMDAKVVMIHTGGTLGMFGLAQRYSAHFTSGEQY